MSHTVSDTLNHMDCLHQYWSMSSTTMPAPPPFPMSLSSQNLTPLIPHQPPKLNLPGQRLDSHRLLQTPTHTYKSSFLLNYVYGHKCKCNQRKCVYMTRSMYIIRFCFSGTGRIIIKGLGNTYHNKIKSYATKQK